VPPQQETRRMERRELRIKKGLGLLKKDEFSREQKENGRISVHWIASPM